MRFIALLLFAGFSGSEETGAQPHLSPVEIMPPPADGAELSGRLEGGSTAIWRDGNILTVLHRSTNSDLFFIGPVQHEMSRIDGTDLWVLRLRYPSWRRVFFGYGFHSTSPATGARESSAQLAYWRGEEAPPPPEEARELRGRLLHRTIDSRYLGERRDITVYLPPGVPRTRLPAIFMADGELTEGHARVVEPLILAGRIRPVALIGVHSGGYRGDPSQPFDFSRDYRAREYLPTPPGPAAASADGRFAHHMSFFTREVPAWAAREMNISGTASDRAVFGYSNGGAFVASVALSHPRLFGNVLAFSVASPPPGERPPAPLPRFFFAAGELETPFRRVTEGLHQRVVAWNGRSSFTAYPSGHDGFMWKIALLDALRQIFPGTARP